MIATFQCLLVLSMVHIAWLLADYDCHLSMSASPQYGTNRLAADYDCHLSMSACLSMVHIAWLLIMIATFQCLLVSVWYTSLGC